MAITRQQLAAVMNLVDTLKDAASRFQAVHPRINDDPTSEDRPVLFNEAAVMALILEVQAMNLDFSTAITRIESKIDSIRARLP